MEIEMASRASKAEVVASTTSVDESPSSSVRQRGDPEKLDSGKDQDETVLARFGKKQQLKRRFKSLSSIGLTCSLMLTWAVVLFTLQFGLTDGGPAGVIYGFLAAWAGAILQALVMAEIASMIPLAGGAFNWVAILSPPSCRKFLSYLTGWLTVITYQAFVAQICFVCATLIQGIIILARADYVPQLWHATLLFYAVMSWGILSNTYLGRILPRIEAFTLVFYVVGFFAILITLVYLSPHRSASDVFGTFQNLGGWDTMGLSFFCGWLTSTAAFMGIDGSDHIAEEIEQAPRVIPFSIWFSAFFNGLLAFGMILAILFVTPDFVAATQSPTGYPFMDIMMAAVGDFNGGLALIIITTIIAILSLSSCMATASRTLWAFSRENGLPLSSFIVKINPNTKLPMNAILITTIVNTLLALISIGNTAAIQAFFSLVVTAYFCSFLIAAGIMLHKRLTTPNSEIPWGPFRLGRLGVPITVVAMCYTALAVFFSFWPLSTPPTAANMNYTSLLFGAAMIFSIVFWFFHGRKVYVGPVWELGEVESRKN